MPDFRLPPYTVTRLLTAQEMADRVDWGQEAQGLPEAWKVTKGRGVKVAVLDTGCDPTHPDLTIAIAAAKDFTNSRLTPPWADHPRDGHGTHCAGIVAARDDGRGVIGFAPHCDLYVGKCLELGIGQGAWIAAAIRWAIDERVHVISMSLGSPDPDPQIGLALEQAVKAGIFVCAAAGNDGRNDSVNYPARWKQPHGRKHLDCLAVGAIQRDGTPAPYSSRGPEVDLAAPGSDVTSCWPGGGYAVLSGTSMATPAVAGMLALMLGQPGADQPIDHDHLRDMLQPYMSDIGQPGQDALTGWGMVRIDELVNRPAPAAPEPPADPDWPVIWRDEDVWVAGKLYPIRWVAQPRPQKASA